MKLRLTYLITLFILLITAAQPSCTAAAQAKSYSLSGSGVILTAGKAVNSPIKIFLKDSKSTFPMGSVVSAPRIIYCNSAGKNVPAKAIQQDITSTGNRIDSVITYSGERSTIWTLRSSLKIDKDNSVSIQRALSSNHPQKIVRFDGILLHAGEDSFGSKKDEGLFPGLEYLLGNEASSSTLDVTTLDHIRFAPHPNKVTIPLMSVMDKGRMITLMWNALQKWDGVNTRPRPLFSSPNAIEKQDNHLMGLFLPSIGYGKESELNAVKPYLLRPGKSLTLTAKIVVRKADHSIDAIDDWIACYGLPAPIKQVRTWPDEVKLCMDAFLTTLWRQDAKGFGWLPWLGQSRGINSDVCVFLQQGADVMPDADYAQKLRERADFAAKALGVGGGGSFKYAYRYGKIRQSFTESQSRIKSIISQQKPDHSWRFYAGEDEWIAGFQCCKLGVLGETASGIVGFNANNLLNYARITGNQEALKAGLNSLDFLNDFTRPQASQVWEVPVHTPDILASARCGAAYVEAYKITGDKAYLDKAVYWARTGFPFIYLWQSPEQPIMKFGTIAVFGASVFQWPWFAAPVQWNGLEYAQTLYSLAKYDSSYNWKALADGIVDCCMQEQIAVRCERYGLYPDSISVITGKKNAAWISPAQYFMDQIFTRMGIESDVDTAILRNSKGTIFTSAPTKISALLNEGQRELNITLDNGIQSKPLAFSVTGLNKPEKVIWNGQTISEGTKDEPGIWTYADNLLVVTANGSQGGAVSVQYKALNFNCPGIADKPAVQVKVKAPDMAAWFGGKASVTLSNLANDDINDLTLTLTAPDGWIIEGSEETKSNVRVISVPALSQGKSTTISILLHPACGHSDSYQWVTAQAQYKLNDKTETSEGAVGIHILNPVAVKMQSIGQSAVGNQLVLDTIVNIYNKAGAAFDGTLDIEPPKGCKIEYASPTGNNFQLSGKSTAIKVQIIAPLGSQAGKFETRLSITTPGGTLPAFPINIELPLLCPKRANPVKIDADLSDWVNAVWTPIDGKIGKADQAKPAPASPDDMSASVSSAWNDKYLYLAFKVQDDVQFNRSGVDIWNADSVQIGLDGLCERQPYKVDSNDHEYGFALTEKGPQAWCWVAPRNEKPGERKNIPFAVKRQGGFYYYEAAIPWSAVAAKAPKTGNVIGISLLANDVDKDGVRKALQLGGGIAMSKDPSEFIVLKLSK